MYPPFYNDSPNEVGFNPISPPSIFYPLYSTPTPPRDQYPQRYDSPNESGFNPTSPPRIRYPFYSTPTSPRDLFPQRYPPCDSTQTPESPLTIINLISSEDESTSSDEEKTPEKGLSIPIPSFSIQPEKEVRNFANRKNIACSNTA